MRPAANTPSSRGTRTSPASASTRTSANWAPKANLVRPANGPDASAPMSAVVSACALSPPGGTAPLLVYFTTDEVPQAKLAALAAEIS
jgi:hypothetical protein